MSSANYMMVTVASCDPTFVEQALQHVDGLAAGLRDKAGAVSTRYGVLATGSNAGCIVLFQSYEGLGGVDKAFKVYGESADYRALMSSGKIGVRMRNIVRLEAVQISNPAPEASAYGVVTRWRAADPMLDRMQGFVPLFEENGATVIRYGTVMTGEDPGKRLLAVGYRSMDAIEKTYDALRASDAYSAMLGEVDIDLRNIIRIVG